MKQINVLSKLNLLIQKKYFFQLLSVTKVTKARKNQYNFWIILEVPVFQIF